MRWRRSAAADETPTAAARNGVVTAPAEPPAAPATREPAPATREPADAEPQTPAPAGSTSPESEPKPEPKPDPKPEPRPATAQDPEPARRRGPSAGDVGRMAKAGVDAVRSRIASLVWLVAVVCALFLAIGALLVALRMNQDNAIVGFVVDGAKRLDLGHFKDFAGKNGHIKERLTDWGIAAVIYLVVGKIADRIIRP